MLLNNQRITLDFTSKTSVKISNITYKEGEKDLDGIIIDALGVSLQESDEIIVNWLYLTQDLYIYTPTIGERVSEKEIKTLPPRGVLREGEVGVEAVILSSDGSEIKSQSGYIPVQSSLVQEDYDGDADDDISIVMQLIAQATDLHQAAIDLNARMATSHQSRINAENSREAKFDIHESNLIQKIDEISNATRVAEAAKESAVAAKMNAEEKASLANNKAALAQTAIENANNAKIAVETSTSNAKTVKEQLETATSSANSAKLNADTKATLADSKAALANDKASLANSATANADVAKNKAAAVPAEIVSARVGYEGDVYADIDTRLRTEFEILANMIPMNTEMIEVEGEASSDNFSKAVEALLAGILDGSKSGNRELFDSEMVLIKDEITAIQNILVEPMKS